MDLVLERLEYKIRSGDYEATRYFEIIKNLWPDILLHQLTSNSLNDFGYACSHCSLESRLFQQETVTSFKAGMSSVGRNITECEFLLHTGDIAIYMYQLGTREHSVKTKSQKGNISFPFETRIASPL